MIREAFARAVAEDPIDLARAALLIAAEDCADDAGTGGGAAGLDAGASGRSNAAEAGAGTAGASRRDADAAKRRNAGEADAGGSDAGSADNDAGDVRAGGVAALAEVERAYAELRAMGLEVAARLEGVTAIAERVGVLARYLHQEVGLRGDTSSYYDPCNSFITHVLARKKGIPISLSVIYMTVGRHAGIPIHGIGFPSHFLMGFGDDQYLDPFHPTLPLDIDDCRALFIRLGGTAKAFKRSMLAPATDRQILTRMLTNLKMIYAQTHAPEKAIAAIDRILLVNPNQAHEYRDRGALRMRLDHFKLAIADFEHYLDEKPAAPERDTIESAVQTLRKRIAMLH
jgi:regulator of sirC expression with transglutaminase-like and TPR domain